MSTDDTISEDVSSSVALSQDHVENSVGKGSEGSIVSSEDAVSGLADPEDDRIPAQAEQTLEGVLTAAAATEKNRGQVTHASNNPPKKSNLRLKVEGSGRSPVTINPSPLETLTALVQEIQSCGATDPEIWRDCEGRWLQLFQLVEKQYRHQILAQQEQYQCQVQLIQDEIKALVRLQNRSRAGQNPAGALTRCAGDSPLVRLLSSGLPGAPVPRPMSSEPRPKAREEGATTLSSSGYGTLSTWGAEGGGRSSADGLLAAASPDSDSTSRGSQRELPNHAPPGAPPANHGSSAAQRKATSQLTSWAQKRRVPRSRSAQPQRPPAEEEEEVEEEESQRGSTDGDRQDECRSSYLKRSDSLLSEASGLTYWRLDEGELYRRLPDSLDSGAYLFLPDLSLNQGSQDDPKLPLSLREIYQRKQEGGAKATDWESTFSSNTSTPQMLTLDPALHTKQSDRTSGFTSPSHFSSPSSPHQPQPGQTPGGPALTPDSMSEGPPAPGLLDPLCPSPGPPTEGGPNGTATAPSPPHTPQDYTPYSTVLAHHAPSRVNQSGCSMERTSTPSSLEDPVLLSLVRQSLKEKHSRHIADLRAYYELEISSLQERLAAGPQHSDGDLEKSSQDLLQRCEHLDRALTEASACIRDLENKNSQLETQLGAWPDRCAAADAAVQALRAGLDAADRSGREKDGALGQLQSRVQELEEALEEALGGASRTSQDRDAQLRKGHEALQELLAAYDSLRKDHERVKDNLVSTENKLFDANSEISELKRFVSKLESQIKQLEHENLVKTRHMIRGCSGLSQQPDLLLSPNKSRPHLNGDRKWSSPEPDPSGHLGPTSDWTTTCNSRCYSPPETPTPMMRALNHVDEARGGEGSALHRAGLGSRRPAVSFLEGGAPGPVHLRAQRSLSPEGHRSSSLPPCTKRSSINATPTKREMLLTPLSAKSSPKRCPTENFSTAFGDSPVQQLYSRPWSDVNSDQTDPSSSSLPRSSSLRKRLQFSSEAPEERTMRPDQEEQGAELLDSSHTGGVSSYQPPVQSLADTERLFDELTQEKQQIEAELSRIPGAGARITLQARLDEVALEKRLEKVNRELGSIRMTLKRVHVLRCSAHI